MELAVELRDIHKSFGRMKANDGASLAVRAGEVHALMGENGAGKSTLMKILYGLYRPDRGEIRVRGRLVRFRSPSDALRSGLGMVHQHFMLVAPMTVTENVMLGREGAGLLGQLRPGRVERELRECSRRFGLEVDPSARVEDLPVGAQQRVEILRVLLHGADILVFDEPTAVLTPPEVEELFVVFRRLREQGSTIVLITHKLDEVMRVSDRVTVLREGRVAGVRETAATTPAELTALMLGREGHPPQRGSAVRGESALEVEGLEVRDVRGLPAVRGVSLAIRAGEIVGLAGVEGNGQTELVEALLGLRPVHAGHIRLRGRELGRLSNRQRTALGIAHIPADRHRHGMVLEMTVRENLLLGRQRELRFSRMGLLRSGGISAYAQAAIRDYDIRPAQPSAVGRDLSGGNQQKVVAARELERDFTLLVAAQPTRGVDVGATEFLHGRLLEARAQGKAVLLVSADLAEVLALSDRILVLHRGRVAGEVAREQASDAPLGRWMLEGRA